MDENKPEENKHEEKMHEEKKLEENKHEEKVQESSPKTFKLKTKYIVGVLVLILALGGVIYFLAGGASQTASNVVAAGDNISVYYTGSFVNGTVFSSNVGGPLFSFIAGEGQVIPGFDAAVLGMKVGQTKNITLPPTEAYGYVNSSLIYTVPITVFGNPKNITLTLGERISTAEGQEGYITDINNTNASNKNDTEITVDFNPPLAGDTLLFQIKVVSINR